MQLKKLLLIIFLVTAIEVSAQQSLTYTPEKPQAGQTITITYTPSGDLANIMKPVSLKYYVSRAGELIANDGTFKSSGKQYTATIPTDTADQLVMLKIYSDNIVDNNNDNGYIIPLYDGDKLKKGADYAMSIFYRSAGQNFFNVDPNPKKALDYLEKEIQNRSGDMDYDVVGYMQLYKAVHHDTYEKELQKTIEAVIASGLKNEADYQKLQYLYSFGKLKEQSNFIKNLMEQKFPDGRWTISQTLQKYFGEQDQSKKEALWNEISKKIDSDPDWKYLQGSKDFYQSALLTNYFKNKDWEGLKNAIEKYHISGSQLASRYNNEAWDMQGKDEDLKQAEKFASYAVTWAKDEMDNPKDPKPAYLTESEWYKRRQLNFATYADTYAMIEYKLGNYKEGLKYAEEAAMKINNGSDPGLNNTYALLAAKVLSPRKYIPQLESMVKNGKATSKIKDILKENYVQKHGESGYEGYMAALEKVHMEKMLAELKKIMLDEESPAFTLKDVDGNKVNFADLKGKVVVVDFWATWCGPCKASFPGMQKMVSKYKNDPSVKFLFVDTWEDGNAKEKNAKDFITENKYDFHVLMDNDNKVVEQFKVNGIPTKFVIDKNGKIRFKSVGFSGSDDGLVQELSAMISLAKEA